MARDILFVSDGDLASNRGRRIRYYAGVGVSPKAFEGEEDFGKGVEQALNANERCSRGAQWVAGVLMTGILTNSQQTLKVNERDSLS